MLTITHNSLPPPSLEFTHDSTTRQLDATLARRDPFKLLEKLPWMMPWMYPRAETKSTRQQFQELIEKCNEVSALNPYCCWALHI